MDFNFTALTSRGQIKDRKVWFIRITDNEGRAGIGEIAPIKRLSPEDPDDIPFYLDKLARQLKSADLPTATEIFSFVQDLVPKTSPSIRFGLEMALLDLIQGGDKNIFTSNTEDISIPVNGLIWMGDLHFMKQQIKEKLDQGFRCIKLKIGSLDFESELQVIKDLRKFSEDLVIRLDANGGFQTNEVLSKLQKLSAYHIHSIEQPILPMQPEAMELICKKSEVPIAFDEELIHVFSSQEKMTLIQDLKPHYLVLKPTLHGGIGGVREWIDLATMHGIDWWVTSYLESNIGLNAIAQFTSLYDNDEFHGLGTGALYSNNVTSPIMVREGILSYANSNVWGDLNF